jgi:hypothetical protein
MNVVEIEEIDDCYESSFVRDIYIDESISEEFVYYLAEFGKLIFQKEIAKPYFKVIVKGRFTIKGALTNKGMRVLFPDDEYFGLDSIINKIKAYESKSEDIK